MRKRRIIPLILYIVILGLILSWMLGLFGGRDDGLTYSQVVEQFKQENVKSFVVEDNFIYMTLHQPVGGRQDLAAHLADPEGFRNQMWELLQQQTDKKVLESYDFIPADAMSPYDFILPIILAGGVLLILWMLFMGRANSKNPMADFGKARAAHNATGKKVTFADVAGVDEEKAELQEVVDFLRNPQKFQEIGQMNALMVGMETMPKVSSMAFFY